MSKFKENLIASLIGIFFAFIVVFAINNYNYLKADLMNSYAREDNVDFVIKNSSVIVNKDVEGLQIIFIKINSNIDKNSISSKYDYLVENMDGYTNIMFLVKKLKKGDVLFKFKNKDLKIGNIKFIFTDGKVDENVLFYYNK